VSAFAILAALYERTQSGQGQHIDLSSTEAIGFLVGEAIMDYTMNKKIPFRQGNRHEFMAPHNYYPCRGKNKWVSIAVASEDEWEALCRVMGCPPWAGEKRFSDAQRRWQSQDELDQFIEEWTVNFTYSEITECLQEAGVAASPVYDGEELYTDPHLQARGFSELVEHPIMGKRRVVGPPWKLSDTPAKITGHGPLLGEHNEYILGELLGLSHDEITKLNDDGVLY
jgi:benzylsuccinate CoA-transferase BbsF subunit